MKASALKREKLSAGPFIVSRRKTSDVEEGDLAKGMLAGLVGGLIGTIVMTQFQNAWSKVSLALKNGQGDGGKQSNSDQQQENKQESEDATMKAAGKIAKLSGRRLSHEERKKLGPVVHYAFGTIQGTAYGVVTELAGIRGGFVPGLVFGAALYGIADELVVPALGLSGDPTQSPLSSHLYGLAAHLVYGVSAEIARSGVRVALR